MQSCRIIGWYNKNNIGDESYKVSFPKLFPQFDFDFEGKKEQYDICILGGGDILNDHYVSKALACSAAKRYVISTSAGTAAPLEQLPQFDGIFVRDIRSVKYLREKGVQCAYMPDVSIGLEPDKESGVQLLERMFRQEGLELYEKRIGLVLNAHLMYAKDGILARDFITFLKSVQDMAKLADSISASFIFFPMSTQMPYDDRIANGFVASRCKFWKKNWLVQERLTVQDTLNLVSACDALVSTRLHSSVFALNSQTPFLDVLHHDKSRSFLETIHHEGHSVSYWDFSFKELEDAVERLLSNSEAHARKLKWTHHHQIETLKREAENVCCVKQ